MNVLASPLFSEIDTGLAKLKIFLRADLHPFSDLCPGTTRYISHEKKKIPVKNRFYKSFIKGN